MLSNRGLRAVTLIAILSLILNGQRLITNRVYAEEAERHYTHTLELQQSSGFSAQQVLELNEIGADQTSNYMQMIANARNINDDVVGWINISDFDISYPVLYSENNKEYLRKNIYGEKDIAGCIYLDANYGNIYSPIKLIHGHNMQNDTMFGRVADLLFWTSLDGAPTIKYCDDLGLKEFQIFSVFSVDSTSESVIVNEYSSLEAMQDLKQSYIKRSWVPITEVPTGTELLMLNTCWYGLTGVEHNLHCIVVAARIG